MLQGASHERAFAAIICPARTCTVVPTDPRWVCRTPKTRPPTGVGGGSGADRDERDEREERDERVECDCESGGGTKRVPIKASGGRRYFQIGEVDALSLLWMWSAAELAVPRPTYTLSRAELYGFVD